MWALGVLLGGGAGATGALLWTARRARRVTLPHALELLVRGRQSVLDLLARNGALEFTALHTCLRPRPTPERLADWLASMLADGTLHANMDREGRAVFARTADGAASSRPQVTFDAAWRERRVDRFEEFREEATRPASGDGR